MAVLPDPGAPRMTRPRVSLILSTISLHIHFLPTKSPPASLCGTSWNIGLRNHWAGLYWANWTWLDSDLRPRDTRLLETLETDCLPDICSLNLETDCLPDMLLTDCLPDMLLTDILPDMLLTDILPDMSLLVRELRLPDTPGRWRELSPDVRETKLSEEVLISLVM